MVASLFQIIIGFTGLIGIFLRFIGPLTIAPTITLVGVALFKAAAEYAGKLIEKSSYFISHWILFSNQFDWQVTSFFFFYKQALGNINGVSIAGFHMMLSNSEIKIAYPSKELFSFSSTGLLVS